MLRLSHKVIAEGIGTFALVFFGCGAIMVMERFPGTLSPQMIAIVFGLVISAMVYAVGHISGAHFNPAVTLAFSLSRHFPKNQVLLYWLGQVLGALFAILFLTYLLPQGVSYGATLPMIDPFKALLAEILLTFFLMFVITAVATDTRAVGTMAGAAIGITVMLCAFVAGPLTGASMNPARSLAPAIFEDQMTSLWIYLLGPMIGACLAAWVYEWIRCDADKKKAEGCC